MANATSSGSAPPLIRSDSTNISGSRKRTRLQTACANVQNSESQATILTKDIAGPLLVENEPSTSFAGNKEVSKSRNRDPWDTETEYLFFEALKLHGKDYDAIRKYIAQKSKSINAKNYDQVRNFYYNTVSKIFSYLNLSDVEAPKEAKEVFALINYGEWKRKTNTSKFNAKCADKFKELVLNGSVSVKVFTKAMNAGKPHSGKKARKRVMALKLKTPICPALKKFFDGKAIATDTSLPKSVTVELVPRTQGDRAYVLDCWQNPFVRLVVSLRHSVKDIFFWLRQKWVPQDIRMQKALLNEDIATYLPDIVLFPSAEHRLRVVCLNPNSSSSNTFACSASVSGFGLRQCFSPESTSSVDQCQPLSPGKQQRKRRKSTVGRSSADANNRAAAVSECFQSAPEQLDKNRSNHQDAGTVNFADERANTSACQQMDFEAENSNEAHQAAREEEAVREQVVVKTPVESTKLENAEIKSTDPVSQNSSSQSRVMLHPDILKQGLSWACCEMLTIGQLCLMCDAASTIRLQYSVRKKPPSNKSNSALNRRSTKEKSNASAANVQNASAAASAATAGSLNDNGRLIKDTNDSEGKLHSDILAPIPKSQVKAVNVYTDEQIIALPASTSASWTNASRNKDKLAGKQMPPPQAVAYSSAVANEGDAFLMQFMQMTRKPVVVTRRRAVKVMAQVANAPFNPGPVADNSAEHLEQRVLPTSSSLPSSSVGPVMHPIHVVGSAEQLCSTTVICGTSASETLAPPQDRPPFQTDVDPQPVAPIPELRDNGAESIHAERSSFADLKSNSDSSTDLLNGTYVNQQAPQQIISSDSFLDFSLSSFGGFPMKSNFSRFMEEDSVPHPQQVPEEDALSSPPRRLPQSFANETDKNLKEDSLHFSSAFHLPPAFDPDSVAGSPGAFFTDSAGLLETPKKNT